MPPVIDVSGGVLFGWKVTSHRINLPAVQSPSWRDFPGIHRSFCVKAVDGAPARAMADQQ
jgi:hypothetical protein